MKKRYLILAFALMFLAMNLGLSTDAVAEKRYGIEWEPLYERIDAHEYKLPEGWQEAVKGIKEINDVKNSLTKDFKDGINDIDLDDK